LSGQAIAWSGLPGSLATAQAQMKCDAAEQSLISGWPNRPLNTMIAPQAQFKHSRTGAVERNAAAMRC